MVQLERLAVAEAAFVDINRHRVTLADIDVVQAVGDSNLRKPRHIKAGTGRLGRILISERVNIHIPADPIDPAVRCVLPAAEV